MLIKLIIAVNDTDKATSPLANLVRTFDVMPPGAAAMIITPRASSEETFNSLIKANAITGSKINWQIKPTIKSFGFLITLVKSLMVRLVPSPSIINANAMGAILVTISIYNHSKFLRDWIFFLRKVDCVFF